MASAKRSFGKYRLIADIGHGGMASVYLAVASGPAGFNKLLVIKQIRPELADDPAFLNMFLDEARLAARVNHPNVVLTLEVGEEGGSYYIAMEYLDGQPLSRIQNRAADRLTLAQRVRILSDVLVGLHHAHELRDYDGQPLGVVHRDATPQNVFITYDGQVKVVDFGVAKAATSSGQTRSGMLKGKLTYMAPEQARGEPIDRRADVFSVGVMLWEALAGRRMWGDVMADVAILHKLVSGELPPVPAGAPAELRAVCQKALAIDPARRYPTAAAMADDLERYLERQPGRGSNREIGAAIASVFAAEREKIQQTINEQLSAISLLSTGMLPSMPRLAAAAEPEPPTLPGPSSSSFTAHPSAASLPPPPEPPAAPPPGKPRRALLGVGAALAAVALAALAVRGLSAQPSAATAPSASAAPRSVEVRVAVTPASARLFFDDEPLPANPNTLRLPADGRTHLVRADAEGYLPKIRQIVLDKDFSIEFSLDRAAAEPAASAAPTGPRPTGPGKPGAGVGAATPPDSTTKKPVKVRRGVDDNNPYAQ